MGERRQQRRRAEPSGAKSLDSEDAEFTEAMAQFDASGAWQALSQQALSEKSVSEKAGKEAQPVRIEGENRAPTTRRGRKRAAERIQPRSAKRSPSEAVRSMPESLDLHGASIEEATEKLERFLVESNVRDRRRVLVVTGKGLRSPGGVPVLRRALSRWLEAKAQNWVREFETAPQRWGGEGALLIHLRRPRPR